MWLSHLGVVQNAVLGRIGLVAKNVLSLVEAWTADTSRHHFTSRALDLDFNYPGYLPLECQTIMTRERCFQCLIIKNLFKYIYNYYSTTV